jgi:ABC-type dipeptide/oligopeptide/nickel transport system permease subunit
MNEYYTGVFIGWAAGIVVGVLVGYFIGRIDK